MQELGRPAVADALSNSCPMATSRHWRVILFVLPVAPTTTDGTPRGRGLLLARLDADNALPTAKAQARGANMGAGHVVWPALRIVTASPGAGASVRAAWSATPKPNLTLRVS